MECSFCMNKLNFFTDARKLPCGHVACMTCVSQELDSFGKIVCPTCRLELKTDDVCSLEAVKLELSVDTLSNAELCGVCTDKLADVFCVTCQMALCSSHKEEDQDKADSSGAPEHYQVRIKQFIKDKAKYRRHYCRVHQDRLTSQACVSCVQVFCTTCDPKLKCPAAESEHVLSSLPEAVKVIKSRIEELQTALSDTIARFLSLEKEMSRKIEFMEKEEAQLIEDVNKTVREQVNHITQEGEYLKTQISTYFGDFKKQAEDLREQLMTSTETAREQTKDLMSINNVSLEGLLLEKFSCIQDEIQHTTRRKFEPISITSKHLITTGRFRRLEVELADVPCFMEYINTVRTGDNRYYSVRWMSADLLVTGSRDGIEMWDSQLKLIRSLRLNLCMDMVPYRDQLVVLHYLSDDTRTIKLYSQTLERIRDIVELPTKGTQLSQIAAADERIVASDPDKKCVYVYTFSGELLHTVHPSGMADPRGVCITADGRLLVSDWAEKGSVRKYQLRGDYSLIWESDELLLPWGIVEDNTGLLYVNRCDSNDNSIYQLSPEGLLLKEMTCDQLTKTLYTYGISVAGYSLAVVCILGGINLFKFK